jgi:hypothetical protein
MIAWLSAHERWLPAIAGVAWWLIFYPGFFGDDSFTHLDEARSGAYTVWFTAWWVYVVDALTLSTRAIPLMTLLSVLALEYAAYFWMTTVFPPRRARAVTVLLIGASPLVGAMGIQVRHDVSMSAGLFIAAVVLIRTWHTRRFAGADIAWLAAVAPLVATRHNGMPTILGTAVLCALLLRWRQAGALIVVAATAAAITYTATRAAGSGSSVHPVQAVEWLSYDLSCVLTNPEVQPTPEEWETLEKIAARRDWPEGRACYTMRPPGSPQLSPAAIIDNYDDYLGVWWSLARRYPMEMLGAHALRVRMFLPPFATGIPDMIVTSFIHSTILQPNAFDLRWAWPAVAERARVVVRAWNAGGLILANTFVWLSVLAIVAWRSRRMRAVLIPTIVVAVSLNLGLVAAAPISEGRYGMFILICGQATALFMILERSPKLREDSQVRRT